MRFSSTYVIGAWANVQASRSQGSVSISKFSSGSSANGAFGKSNLVEVFCPLEKNDAGPPWQLGMIGTRINKLNMGVVEVLKKSVVNI